MSTHKMKASIGLATANSPTDASYPTETRSLPILSFTRGNSLTLPVRSMTMPLPLRRHIDFTLIPAEPVSGTRMLPPTQWAMVAVAVFIMVATWSIMAESLQGLNRGYQKVIMPFYWVFLFSCISVLVLLFSLHFRQPLLMVGIVQWGFAIVFFPVWLVWRWWIYRSNQSNTMDQPDDFFTWKEFFLVSIFTSSFQLGTRFTWYLSLVGTSVAANSIIWQSACVLVYVLSVPLLKAPVTWLKSVAVVSSVLGAGLVMSFTTNEPEDPSTGTSSTHSVVGYVFLFISLFLFAMYEVANKRWAQSEDDPWFLFNCVRLLLAMGVTGGLICTPIILIIHWTGIEPIEWPGSYTPLLIFNVVLDSLYNLSLLMCVALTSPLFASISGILVVPATVALDWYLHGLVLPTFAFAGMGLIFAGFVAMNAAEYFEREESVRFRDREGGHQPTTGYVSIG